MDQFEQDVKQLISLIPVNEETSKKNIFLFVTNSGFTDLTRNALCSLMRTNIVKDRIVVLTLDDISYASIETLGVHVLLYPTALYSKKKDNTTAQSSPQITNTKFVGPVTSQDNAAEFFEITKANFKSFSFEK